MNRRISSLSLALSLTMWLPLSACCDQGSPDAEATSLSTAKNTTGIDALETASSPMVLGEKLLAAALPWEDREYRAGKAEQCMNWTREILVAACGEHFATLETKNPWDKHLLDPDDTLLPEHVDSLAGDEFGEKIHSIESLQAGDLVFLKNT